MVTLIIVGLLIATLTLALIGFALLVIASGLDAVRHGALEPPEDDQWPDT